ncbi:uncharacterized protein [Hetaerina americana]|uniref:uncharacterized protein n=1 Tax=Hetaerina americana TaxID=62018 RepID=UPI003A7F18D0
MCDKAEFEVCRLCLNSRGLLINVFGENRTLRIMLEKTIEDLIGVKVVEDANYPWLVCSNCMEKLTEFRLFKRRCAECLSVFYNRIQKGFNPATKDWVTNREKEGSDVLNNDNKGAESAGDNFVEGTLSKNWALSTAAEAVSPSVHKAMLQMQDTNKAGSQLHFTSDNNFNELVIESPSEIKKEIDDYTITGDIIESTGDIRDDMIIVKKEVDTASECSASLIRDIDSSLVPSMQQGCSHWSDNKESGNLASISPIVSEEAF